MGKNGDWLGEETGRSNDVKRAVARTLACSCAILFEATVLCICAGEGRPRPRPPVEESPRVLGILYKVSTYYDGLTVKTKRE